MLGVIQTLWNYIKNFIKFFFIFNVDFFLSRIPISAKHQRYKSLSCIYFLLLSLLFIFVTPNLSAQTEIYIGISPDKVPAQNLFLSAFVPITRDTETFNLALQIREVVRADLMFSRYFNITEDLLNPLTLKNDKESLNYFSKIAKHLVFAEVEKTPGNFFLLKGQIFDLRDKKKIFERNYQSKFSSIRRLAHIFSDDIVFKLTERKGIAHTRIAFANDATKNKEIYIVDYDGENLTRLTDDRNISLLPVWSNDGTKIYYTSYKRKNPDIFEIDLRQGKIVPFVNFQGLNLAGGFSPNGLDFVMTLSKGADPNIYVMNIETKEMKKLLTKFGVNSSPTYSPDGKEIAFVSDISGNPQLYVYNLGTSQKRKITRLNWADSPNWSPTGQWIVFSGRETLKEKMNIFLVDPTGSQIKRLTRNEGDNEDPSFSPDSRFIVFTSTRRGRREIFVMDIDGSSPHPLVENLRGNSYTPMWSP